MTTTSDELKESAYAIRTLAGATHHYQYVAMCMLGAAILDTIATVSADEPDKYRSPCGIMNGQTVYSISEEYADHYRNKAMQLAGLIQRVWKEAGRDEWNDDDELPGIIATIVRGSERWKKENEQLRKELAEAQKDAERWKIAHTSRNYGITNYCEYGMRTSFDEVAEKIIDAAIAQQGGKHE